ncbi:MAG: CocE/NonD family hydrolase [Acidobacteria bacterium]|nr:CocE/NonD family hydrolase [Acidobacteriota bacterium]
MANEISAKALGLSVVSVIFGATLVAFGAPIEKSRPIHPVKIRIDLKVPMRDGVRLSADVYRPDSPGKFPALLLMTPYNNQREDTIQEAVYFAKRGYAVALVDLRGRHDSEGVWDPYVNDPRDGHDTHQWLGQQEWCDGKIGTFGRSYVGFTQLMPAPYQSPYLKCMVPVVCQQSNYGHVYNDGVLQLNMAFVAGFFWAGRTMQFTWGPGITGNPLLDWNKYFGRLPLINALDDLAELPWLKTWIQHPTYDDYWKSYGIKEKYHLISAPAYFITGWYDNLVNENWKNLAGFREKAGSEKAKKGSKILVGPWTHSINQRIETSIVDFGPDIYLDVMDLHVRWYDHWLKGMQNDIDSEAPIRIFVMRANRWRDEWEWPLKRTAWTKYYLNSGGKAQSLYGDGRLGLSSSAANAAHDVFVYDPAHPVETVGGQTEFPAEQRGPQDRRGVQRRQDVLVYTSDPLGETLEITGPIEVKLYASSTAVDTDFTATLTEVLPDGRAAHISEGIVRAALRDSLEKESFLEPGKVYPFTIKVWETSWEFQPGSRIRLEISSSNFPRFARNLNTGAPIGTTAEMKKATQTIYHSTQYPSHVLLPVIRK